MPIWRFTGLSMWLAQAVSSDVSSTSASTLPNVGQSKSPSEGAACHADASVSCTCALAPGAGRLTGEEGVCGSESTLAEVNWLKQGC